MPFEFNQPSTPDQKVQRAAESLHELAFSGQPADSKMRQEVAELNQEFAGNKGMLAQIGQQYKALSKNDALFGNEVAVGKDGSLTFTPNTVTSHQLRDYSSTAAKQLKALHKLESKMNKEEEEGSRKQLGADEQSWAKMSKEFGKTQQSMEHEEHLLAAAPMNPNGEVVTPGKGYSAADRAAMQNVVDRSLAQSGPPVADGAPKIVGGSASKSDYDFYGASYRDAREYAPTYGYQPAPNNAIQSTYERLDLDIPPYNPPYNPNFGYENPAQPAASGSVRHVSSGDFNGYESTTPDENVNRNNALLKFYGQQ
jgi:hypothetical protein